MMTSKYAQQEGDSPLLQKQQKEGPSQMNPFLMGGDMIEYV